MDATAITTIFDYVASNGFAIALCIYMIVNNNKTMQQMSDLIKDNTNATNNLVTLITTFINTHNQKEV